MKWFLFFASFTVLSGCIVSSNTRNIPKPGSDNLSGLYMYSGLRGFSPIEFTNPLVDFSEIRMRSEIEITQTGTVFIVKYQNNHGRTVVHLVDPNKDKNIRWENGMLFTKIKDTVGGVPILPGYAKQYRGSKIFQDSDGNLRILGFSEEKGLMLFLVPFSDYDDYQIILKRKNT